MGASMSAERLLSDPKLQVPTKTVAFAAIAYSQRCYQRVLASWVQDLLERRRVRIASTALDRKAA